MPSTSPARRPSWATDSLVGYGVGNLGSTEATAFPKLEVLVINNMPNWEEWSFVEEEEVAKEEGAAAAKEGGEKGAAGAKQKEEEALPPRSSWLLPCLKDLQLVNCPKLRALPRQLVQQAISLKKLLIARASCLRTVEDLPYLSNRLFVGSCRVLERVSNLPQVRKFLVNSCPNLRRVEELANLEQLLLDKDMEEISELWIPGLQEQRHRVHGDELEVSEWL
uniref:Rx N-terminal domain-containing protein n=1 Tax=Leersia perrieri TaxID=77586 RepID=A0A0D9XV96_9ORYZ